jgi:hypothetical protein
VLPASPTPTWTQARARIAGLIARGAADDDPRVIQARADLVAARRASELDRAIDDPATLARAARIVATASPSPPPRTVTPMPREPAFNFHVRALRRLVTAAGPGLEPEVVDSVVLARTQHILRRIADAEAAEVADNSIPDDDEDGAA